MVELLSDKRVVVIPGVDDVRATFETFKWPDLVVFGVFLLTYLLMGVYFGFFNVSKSMEEYLAGGRKLKVIPVAFSITASFVSGITMLEIPSDTYIYGMQHLFLIIGHVFMTVVMTYVFLPVLYCSKSISIYEYLEKRFDKRMRLFASLLFILSMIAWLPVVVSIPISTFSQVTKLNIYLSITILCVLCIFNTSLGGIKYVVWADTCHIIIIILVLTLVTIIGTLNLGLDIVIERNLQSTRIEGPNLDLFSSKYTFWSATIGGCFYYLHILGTNQNVFQKYSCLPSLGSAKIAAWLFVLILSLTTVLLTGCGFLLYAIFHDCDPLTTKLVTEKKHLLPLLVMKISGNYLGFSGIFVAGVYSACLSSWSTTLNAITSVVVEDFYPFFFTKKLSQKPSVFVKLIPATIGVICLCLAFVLNEISEKIVLITAGPLLGIFTTGIIFPWVNSKGALTGGISSLIFTIWLSTGTLNSLTSSVKPVTTDGCRYHFTPPRNSSDFENHFFHISHLWSTFIGSVIVIAVGLSLSLFGGSDPRDVDPGLLAPVLRKMIKPREFPNEPGDGIIYAYYISEKRENNAATNFE